MKKTILNKYDKTKISELPRVLFEGRIVVILNESEAQRAVDYLLSQTVLGVDTETRPSFKKGHMNKVALLQVASHNVCFLFRLNLLGKSPSVKRLLEDTTVPKIGLSWHADILNERQKQYAATDAWACIMLYEELMRLEKTGDYELIKIADDVQADSVTEREG